MNVIRKSGPSTYSAEARAVFTEFDARVGAVFEQVEAWRGWRFIMAPETPAAEILAVFREIFRSVAWYQSHTTEAGFHMFGRLPKGDVKLIRAWCSHKAEEAEHGLWAMADHARLSKGNTDIGPASPATFAVASVWWRIAEVEEPLAYVGPEYLFEKLTAMVTQALLPMIEARDLPREPLRFIISHATEDQKHATFFKHQILDVVTRYPHVVPAMRRCFDYFNAVYPLPVWDEAFLRARSG